MFVSVGYVAKVVGGSVVMTTLVSMGSNKACYAKGSGCHDNISHNGN